MLRFIRIRSRGFTIPELLLFIVVVSVALAGVLAVLNLDAGRSADPAQRKQAIAVAEAFMDEVMTREFSNPDGYTGLSNQNNRPVFIDVDDFNGFSSSGIYTRGSAFVSGALIGGLEDYSVAIQVAATTIPTGPSGQQVGAGKMKKITVQVTTPGGEVIPLVAYLADI
jgi:MSHA pilin protein MshD